jgi:hypothetical protein
MRLMHGRWDIKELEINKNKLVHEQKHGANLGIGIVVPAITILETIRQPDLFKARELLDEDWAEE